MILKSCLNRLNQSGINPKNPSQKVAEDELVSTTIAVAPKAKYVSTMTDEMKKTTLCVEDLKRAMERAYRM